MVPLLVVVLLTKFEGKEWVGLGVFLLASLTDFLDGFIARRKKQVTQLGKLLDPAADKLLTSAAFISLVELGLAPAWMVVVIIGRELAVTGLRSIASSDGHVVGASWQGKLKSLVQNFSVGSLLFHYPTIGLPAHEIGLTLLGAATALTLWSGYVYFADYFGWKQPIAS